LTIQHPLFKRVFVSTINFDHFQAGIVDAFSKVFTPGNIQHFDYLQEQRNGKSLQEVNERFLAAARAWNPDWVFLQVQETNVLQAQTLARLKRILPKCPISHWMGDCRTTVSPYLASICREAHLSLISSVGQTGMFMEAGAKEVRYLQIGLDWEEDVMGNPPWDPPFRIPAVVFCGGYYGNLYPGTVERERGVMAVRNAGIDIGIVGNGWPEGFPVVGVSGVKQQHHIWKRCKVALNINNFNDIQSYYSDRQIIAMASGNKVQLVQATRYPWDGAVKITVSPAQSSSFAVNVRIPGWARGEAVPSDLYRFADASNEPVTLKVNDQVVSSAVEKGYARIQRQWKAGDVVELSLPMPVRRVVAHPSVEADQGRFPCAEGTLTAHKLGERLPLHEFHPQPDAAVDVIRAVDGHHIGMPQAGEQAPFLERPRGA
jgi:hypothetical protein